MKTLLLVRHAKSEWGNPDLDDQDRPLNKRGTKDAPMMGELLMKKRLKPQLIISSPAVRAKTTAEIIANKIDYNPEKIQFEERIYSGNYRHIIKILENIDNDINTVFLFGHNPDITFLATFLSGQQFGNIPTTGMACLDFDLDSWEDISNFNGNLRFFDYPKNHKND